MAFHKLLHHQIIHPRPDIGIGKVTAYLLGQLVVSCPAYPRHHGIAPLCGKGDEVALERLVVVKPLTAHGDIVLDGLAVPFAGDLKLGHGGVTSLVKISHGQDASHTSLSSAVLVGLLVAKVILDAFHNLRHFAVEVSLQGILQFCETLCVLHCIACSQLIAIVPTAASSSAR